MGSLINDIKYALRQLAGSPGFTAFAVQSLAPGIGAKSAMAFVSCWLPARRAARIDPMEALRYE